MRLSLIGLLVACVYGAVAAPSQGATWKVMKLPDPSVQVALYGVSCASTSLCVAVGGNGTVAASTRPADGAGEWKVFRPSGSVDLPDLGGGGVIYGGAQIRGVSCPARDLCVAASFDGRILSSANPAAGAGAWKVVPLSEEKQPNHHMGGVSCPSPSFCVAVAYSGKVLHSHNPRGDSSDWSVTVLDRPLDLRGVSCPSPSLCVAVDNEGEIVSSADPTGGPSAWKSSGAPMGENSMNGVSCPSTSLCVTGSAGGIAVSTNPSSPSSWRVVSAGTGLPIKGVSCPSTTACAAIDNNADVIASTNPTGGAWWFTNVLPYGSEGPGQGNGMFGISCPGTSLCVGAGQDSQLVISTDPFVRDSVRREARRRSKLPRVVLTSHPPKRLDHRRRGAGVTFRFRAVGKAVGFRCKVKRRRYRRCRSPLRYRVGGGRHVFKVRAIAPGGRKGPPTAFHFRVGKLLEPRPAGSCPRQPSTPTQPPGAPAGRCVPST